MAGHCHDEEGKFTSCEPKKRGRKPSKPKKVKSASRSAASKRTAATRRRIEGKFATEQAYQNYIKTGKK